MIFVPHATVVIEALGKRHSASRDTEVWIHAFGSGGDTSALLNWAPSTGWERRGPVLLSYRDQPSRVEWAGHAEGGFRIVFGKHPYSGLARVSINGTALDLDLYAADETRETVRVEGYATRRFVPVRLVRAAVIWVACLIITVLGTFIALIAWDPTKPANAAVLDALKSSASSMTAAGAASLHRLQERLGLSGARLAAVPWLIAGIASCTLVAVHLYLSYGAESRAFPDTEHYVGLAAFIPVSDILQQPRPPLAIGWFGLFGMNHEAMVQVQTALYLSSWIMLFVTLTVLIRSAWLTALAIGSLCYFALYPDFAAWTHTLLTEATSISLTVLATAAFLLWFASRSLIALIAMTVALVLYAHLRDVGSYYSLMFGGLVFAVAVLQRVQRRAAFAALVVLFGNFCIVTWLSNAPGAPFLNARWHFPMLNNIGQRILPNPEFTQFFVNRGMPMTSALNDMTGHWAHERERTFYRSTELEEFRTWLRQHGKETYARLLITHPVYFFTAPMDQLPYWLHLEGHTTGHYLPHGFKTFETGRVEFGYLYAVNAVIALAFVLRARIRRTRQAIADAVVMSGLCLIAVGIAYFTYHADAMEIARHSLPVPLQAVLLLAVAAVLASRENRFKR